MLEGGANDVKQQGTQIDFMASDITVLSQQPGLGKTHSVIEFCKKNPDKKILYLTTGHRLIDETIKIIPNASHWHGFTHPDGGCPKYQTTPRVRKLQKASKNISLTCSVMECDKAKCRYWKQFSKSDIVFAPVNYVNTNHVWENEIFNFDICFIDESILKTDKLNLDLEECKKAIQAVREVASIDDIVPLLENRDYKNLGELKSKIKSDIDRALYECGISGNYRKMALIDKLNIYEILEYGFYDGLYRDKIANCKMINGFPIYYKPFSYKIFEIAQQVPVVMLDASFQETLFKDHLEFFNFEYGLTRDLKITIYQSKVENHKSIIYRMYDTSAHPRTNFKDHKGETMPWILRDLERIYKIFGFNNLGIITFKDLIADNVIMGRKESFGFEAMSYGILLGSNSFDGKKVLVES